MFSLALLNLSKIDLQQLSTVFLCSNRTPVIYIRLGISLMENTPADTIRKREFRVFLFITVVLFPILSIILVGGMGFLIWMSQIVFGPPSA